MTLKTARIKAGFLTQQALADRLKVSRITVVRWETGEKRPTQKNVMKLCILLNATADDLYLKPHFRKGNTK